MKTFDYILVGNGVLTFQAAALLEQRGHTCRAVVTEAADLAGWAKKHQLPLYATPKQAEQAFAAAPLAVEYVFSIANLEILGPALLKCARTSAINFHDGPLPRYAGIHATSWALLHREPMHGITWHLISDRVDEGDILVQREVPIAPSDTAYSLNTKCLEAAIASFATLVEGLETSTITRQPQDLTAASYFGKFQRPAQDGFVDWSKSPEDFEALIRALDLGPTPNRLASAKIILPDGTHCIAAAAEAGDASVNGTAAGQIVSVGADAIEVRTGEHGTIRLKRLRRFCGAPLALEDAIKHHGVAVGAAMQALPAKVRAEVEVSSGPVARAEGWWVRQLEKCRPADLYFLHHAPASSQPVFTESGLRDLAPGTAQETADFDAFVAAFCGAIWRVVGQEAFSIGLLPTDHALDRSLYARFAPLNVDLPADATPATLRERCRSGIEAAQKKGPWMRDVFARYPELTGKADVFHQMLRAVVINPGALVRDCDAAIQIARDAAGKPVVRWDATRVTEWQLREFVESALTVFAATTTAANAKLAEIEIVGPRQRGRLLTEWNPAAQPIPTEYVHSAFERNARQSPEHAAVIFHGATLTYRELDARAEALAQRLREMGVGPDKLVGIFMDRSHHLMVALYAVLKAGGAYLPLDPKYPADRLAFMITDSGANVVLTDSHWKSQLPASAAHIIAVDEPLPAATSVNGAANPVARSPHNLAYVIYTSGSTGKPKGVMVTHHNVVNFYLGMDERIGPKPGVWLAVTSISFDISVLELFWTLARGFTIVLAADEDRLATPVATRRRPAVAKPVDFSLFYFASEMGGEARDRYRLLLEGAKYGDENGFAAVWTPERHFHSFGGLFSNPSVASAALATHTKRIGIRAGSVVSALHHPVRLAEEWALVDNLSGGRVGISFASGWQANDFVFAPERYANRKEIMFQNIEAVRKLWRGEALTFPNGEGKPVETKIYPDPIQRELPVWVTAAANPETFREAGKIGANVLTHLLGQKFEDVEAKIKIYREARAAAGHPGRGHVTLMLHTFVGETMESVKETVRGPMCRYLGTAIDLIRNAPFAFPTFKMPNASVADKVTKGIKQFTPEDMQALLGFAFERYFETSGLFGTVERCVEISQHCQAIDVDEIGCLVDFGVPVDQALEGLKALNEVRLRTNAAEPTSEAPAEFSLLSQIRAHGVTHLQCTPSMARMLADQPGGIDALAGLHRLMLGGEALPADLIARLRTTVRGEVHNMYGPTETTIWSTTGRLPREEDFITIGTPIANTQVYVVDRNLRLLPAGAPGELLIGGDGVTRGYLNRAELTQEKFVPDTYIPGANRRVYRTGDLVAWRNDGRIDFLGRLDHQVKIRGYRIELGEIEHALCRLPDVATAIVVPRSRGTGESDLVAYYQTAGATLDAAGFRTALSAHLPDFMIPAHFVRTEKFPTTPNGKIDRKALAALPIKDQTAPTPGAAPESDLEKEVAGVFTEALEISTLGVDANFFELGANSLTMVRVATKLAELYPGRVGLVDLFQHTTIRLLARFLAQSENGEKAVAASKGSDRGRRRREMMRRQS